MEAFVEAPSEKLLFALNKEQLLQLAEKYGMELSSAIRTGKKGPLRDSIHEFLCEQSILPSGKGGDAHVKGMSEPMQSERVGILTFEQQREMKALEFEWAQQAKEKERLFELEKIKLERELQQKADMERLKFEKEMDLKKGEMDLTVQLEKIKIEQDRLKLMSEGKISGNLSGSSMDSMVKYVPKFDERDPDVFFSLFEQMASDKKWSEEDRTVLLQTVLVGRAREAYLALTPVDRHKYAEVKKAVLKCYELNPEAYRQRFRNWRKRANQTHAGVARELSTYFNRWLTSESVSTYENLRDLLILEQFKNIVPDRIATYINEQKAKSVEEAASLADTFVLTHKRKPYSSPPRYNSHQRYDPARSPPQRSPPRYGRSSNRSNYGNSSNVPKFDNGSSKSRPSPTNKCHYCLQEGHWKKDCPLLKGRKSNAKVAGCVSVVHPVDFGVSDLTPLPRLEVHCEQVIEDGASVSDEQTKSVESAASDFAPFISDGWVSLVGETQKVPVKILRDTGASESFISGAVLPFSTASDTGKCVLIRGIGMQSFSVPLHKIHLCSGFVNGEVTIAVRPSLPMQDIHVILGNNLGGCLVSSPPVVTPVPLSVEEPDACCQEFPEVFTACAVTRAMSRTQAQSSDVSKSVPIFVPELPEPLSCQDLIEAQKNDQSFEKYFALASTDPTMGYFIQNGVLLHTWLPGVDPEVAGQVIQVMVPDKYRDLILRTAHGAESGHFGVKKTYRRLLEHFYWPRMKRHVSRFVKACHVCQVAKQSTPIKPAPLQPIPSVGTPFEHLIIDCVGPLPPSKSGCVYLFTIMCQATRYPAAYALRTITTRSILKCLSKFISVFGIPKVIQSDRGSNFTSRTFAAALKSMQVKHNLSSAYHAQSQGALERWHATLKSLLRAYCVEMRRDWEEALPWLLLSARGVVQESTGFSPNDLVFGHKVRTSLSVLNANLDLQNTPVSFTEYVDGFRRRLLLAWKEATEHLTKAQVKMKLRYDRKAKIRVFNPGDQVLALLPIPGSPFTAKYSGPFTVMSQVSDLNYLLSTPDRKRSQQLCHVNLLKPYHSAGSDKAGGIAASPVGLAVGVGEPLNWPEVAAWDEVRAPDDSVLHGRLDNTQQLKELDSLLGHLSEVQRKQLSDLIFEFLPLFSDTPTCTTLIEHDIDTQGARPIRQRFYRVAPDKQKSMEDSVQYLLDHGLAKPSYSSWASPCLLVKKSDNTYRFCTDYRKVNAVTRPDYFPLPRIEDCVDQVGSARYVSKFDLLKGYYQVPLTQRAQEISAFITSSGLYSYTRMSFGLRNAPATFQRLMNRVVGGLQGCSVYLDDAVCHSDSWDEHLARIRALFQRLVAANLTVNLAKCEFARATVVYLGKVVGQGMVRPVNAKVAAIDNFPVPATKKELMRFLGMIGYYRNFCCNFSTVVSPLTNLLKGGAKFIWSEECQQAFQNAKLLLTSAPVLAAPKLDLPFQLQVDASQVGAGAVLLQADDDGVARPVCYFSKKFNKYQFNYSVIEKEALALIWALQHFEVYVGGGLHPIVVYSDHNPLTFLQSFKGSTNQRLLRWALFLQPFHLLIRHIRGVENVMADALSRALDQEV
ncbi:uncharacterized protein LOC133543542 [Nerophis ophidion]|uniref:uncharacterized protein LOC133543542 n=1 Tax=Nerophis ophidion TaxID=159077 RepID=UPI002ADFB3FB|nr:uncharacterized protein LOC133543542 [Nerophis ophidion]